MNQEELRTLIATEETLTVEFKSDQGPLSDADLIETIVCMANGQGGTLLVGVEDDGTVTGLHAKHRTHPAALAAFVASRTVPPVSVEAEFVDLSEGTVAVLVVPASRQPISTSDGRLLVRYWDSRGQPGCRPLYAYELTSWLAERGQADATALIVPDASWDDLDPLEFARLRRMVEENPGDRALLALSDREIASALGLTRSEGDRPQPTLAGLLLVGKESALKDYVPAHEVAFQVLHGTDVAVNEFRRWPLLRIHEWLVEAIGVRNEEQELMIGGMRIGVPLYDRAGVREAVNNALIHRDYSRLGAVHVQLRDDAASLTVRVSNPGGFVEGVRPDNLLVTEPRPRNPRLADAFKRAGLVERTGRGVETIYRGQLRNGRRPPDYTLSTVASVSVILPSGPADLDFVLLAVQAGRRLGRALEVDELLALWQAWREDTTTAQVLAPALQRSAAHAAGVLVGLAQAGLLQETQDLHRLAPELYREAGLEPTLASPEDTILAHVQAHGRITRREAMALCQVSERQATYLLRKLTDRGELRRQGSGRGTVYTQHETSETDK
ncbi:MAG: putative DNA binding domain-containing protein [Chloroflexi bacterium]|nr:putative DNA binding domain-containing protein [Chloroflexota bacterium]